MLYQILAAVLFVAPLAATVASNAPKTEKVAHRDVKTEQIKQWYDQKKPMVVLDARTKPYFDGKLLPNAKWVPADAPEKDIQAAIPSKDSLVVVYCAGPGCPASGWLYDKLISLGYTNLYEYHAGINEWAKKGLPMSQQ
ncbi:MAG: rhodanese-like domain-containing protein [Parachlamydiaceae bacterium]